MKAEIYMKPQIVCPNCQNHEGFSCEHILNGERRQFGPWFCDDCGHSITGKLAADGTIDIEVGPERSIKTLDLLVLPPQSTPVYFVVQGARHEGRQGPAWFIKDRDEADHKKYLYETHSCPTNWFKPVVIYIEGDNDPHGFLDFVAFRDDATFPPDESYGPNPRDAALVEFIESFSTNANSHRRDTEA
jgi:hypothetical protein